MLVKVLLTPKQYEKSTLHSAVKWPPFFRTKEGTNKKPGYQSSLGSRACTPCKHQYSEPEGGFLHYKTNGKNTLYLSAEAYFYC